MPHVVHNERILRTYRGAVITQYFGRCPAQKRSGSGWSRRTTKNEDRGKYVLLVELITAIPTSHRGTLRTHRFMQDPRVDGIPKVRVRVRDDKKKKNQNTRY